MKRKKLYQVIIVAILFNPVTTAAKDNGEIRPDLSNFIELTIPHQSSPHPLAVLLPGCMGWHPHHQRWHEDLLARGFATLQIDSFGLNGLLDPIDLRRYVCSGLKVRWDQRANDLRNALKKVFERPDISVTGGIIFGWSHGASSSLEYILQDNHSTSSYSKDDSLIFEAAFLFYPYCGPGTRWEPRKEVRALDTIIFHGTQDRITDPVQCKRRVNRLRESDIQIEFFPLEGSGHWFDNHREPRAYNKGSTTKVKSLINEKLKILTDH